ncbi:MAG: GNAT family protein [Myxococcota bacterium]
MSATSPAHHLKSDRLHLEAFDPGAVDEVVAVLRAEQARLKRYMPFAVDIAPLEKQREIFATFRKRFADRNFTFFIRHRSSGRFLGGCGLHPTVGPLGAEIGYWLREEAVGHGYASEAVKMLCCLAFEQEGLDRVELRIEPANEPSIAVAARLGFRHEGVLARRFPWPGEEPRDVSVFTLFRHEFAERAWAQRADRFDESSKPLPAANSEP